MVTLGNGSMRSHVVALKVKFSSFLILLQQQPPVFYTCNFMCLPRHRQELRDWVPGRPGFASGTFLGERGSNILALSWFFKRRAWCCCLWVGPNAAALCLPSVGTGDPQCCVQLDSGWERWHLAVWDQHLEIHRLQREWGQFPGCACSGPVAWGHTFWEGVGSCVPGWVSSHTRTQGCPAARDVTDDVCHLNVHLLCLQILVWTADSSLSVSGQFPSVLD